MTHYPDPAPVAGIRAWHIAGIAAAVCLIGGSFLTTEVCKPAPVVSSTPTKSVMDSINDALPTGLPSFDIPYDPLPGMTTTPRATTPRTTTTTAAPAKYDLDFAPGAFPVEASKAWTSCHVDTGRQLNLPAKDAVCLINTGAFTARGTPPPGSIKPGVTANAAGQVCTAQKPIWYYLGFPLMLLTAFLAWTSFSSGRRGEHGEYVTSQFAGEPDLPPPPSAPSFDPTAAGGAQTPPPTGAPPSPPRAQAHTHSYDDFDSEDY